MHPDIKALLDLQAEDTAIAQLEHRIRAFDPQLKRMDQERAAAVATVAQSKAAIDADERLRHELHTRITAHRQLQERNLAQLDVVRKMKESTAAMAQVEVTRKIIADEEAEMAMLSRRVSDSRSAAERQAAALAALDDAQGEARQQIAAERTSIESELSAVRAQREAKAQRVARSLLGKYDRIRGRRVTAVFALREQSCGNCDTAIPLQRRNLMLTGGAIEICEACGVLLYAGDEG